MRGGEDVAFEIDFATGTKINLDELRRRRSAFMPDNGHAWTIQVVHALDDPEQALDSMMLDADSFIGVTAIACLLCGEEYRTVNRFHKCSQTLTTSHA